MPDHPWLNYLGPAGAVAKQFELVLRALKAAEALASDPNPPAQKATKKVILDGVGLLRPLTARLWASAACHALLASLWYQDQDIPFFGMNPDCNNLFSQCWLACILG